ncbi:hypothetical protein [Nitrospirillum viridazoti]|uniref:Uncharacterized protein n=1 Tax=Nitrospirillum amazonense TaxID=28077 RepID=A0A560HXR6_9PROT|nr:hypothetical protein [Nitrospirillum amazonense]TWB51447.1 hypothetical protein FBZ92_12040 [Nitrospirillum amazonense]
MKKSMQCLAGLSVEQTLMIVDSPESDAKDDFLHNLAAEMVTVEDMRMPSSALPLPASWF